MYQSLKHVPVEAISSYKAAGIVPFHGSSIAEGWFLLGRDTRRRSKVKARVWCDFGGKIDRKLDLDDPWITATREFGEETAGALNGWSPVENDVRAVVWNGSGKYLLFLAESPAFDVAHASLRSAPEKDLMAWVKGCDLMERAAALPTPAAVLPMEGFSSPKESMSSCQVVAFPFFLYSFRVVADATIAKTKQ